MTAKKNGAVQAVTVTTKKNGSEPDKPQVRFHVTAERTADLELGLLLDIQEYQHDLQNHIDVVVAFMTGFLADENGEYLSDEEAKKEIRKVTLRQLMAAFNEINSEILEIAAPNE